MPITVDARRNDFFLIPDRGGLHKFVEEEAHGVLLFKRAGTGRELRLPEHEFVDLHGKGKLTKVIVRDGEIVKHDEIGPGELWTETGDPAQAKLTEAGKRALALRFFTLKWDMNPNRPLGNAGLQELIDRYRPFAIAQGFEPAAGKPGYKVQPATLRRCIHNCGIPGERPLSAFVSRRGKGMRKRYGDLVETLLAESVSFYYEERSRDFADAYAFFRTKIDGINAERARNGAPLIEKYPTRPEVLRRRIRRAQCHATWAMKYGSKAAYKKFKGQKGHIAAQWPLELAIMDSTTFDDWVVLDTSSYLPLGRPTLTVCLDVATRMPLGYVLTFEPPSLYSAMLTFKRVNKAKTYMKQLYPHITRAWDGWGLPSELLLDQDWSHKAPSLQHSLGNLGTDLHWAPADTPEYKTVGERFFRTMNTRLAHKLAGGVPYDPRIMRQVGLDPKKDAVLTLSDLDALIHEVIVDMIHDKHRGLGGVIARIWRDKLLVNRRRFINDVTALDHILGVTDTATLAPSGIEYKGMQFHDPELTGELLDDLVKHAAQSDQNPHPHAPSSVKVVIKHNPADAGGIVVWNRASKKYVRLPNKDPRFFEGISFWHVERIQEHCKRLDLDFSNEADRWKGRDDLRKRYEKLAGKLPMRETRDARRSLASSLGQFDDVVSNEAMDITVDAIHDAEAEPSVNGLNAPEPVPDELAVLLLDDENRPPKGRSPTKATLAKIRRTKAANRQEEAEAAHEAEVKAQRGDPTGDPAARGTIAPDEYADGEGWEDMPNIQSAEAPVAPDTPGRSDDDDFAGGEGWDD